MVRHTVAATILLAACVLGLASAGEPIPFELPKDAKPVMKQGRHIGWGLGLDTNPLVILKPEPQGSEAARAIGPLAVDAEFKRRDVPDAAAWEKVRAELKKRMAAYFGTMPPRDLPLDPKVEKEEDREDHTLQVVSIAFDKERRGRIGLLVPKGLGGHSALRTPHSANPCILLNDRWGGGIALASKGVYSRAIAAHFVREGFVVAVIEHWDEQFGTSSDLCTAGAASHNVMRAVDYLATLKGLVDPQRIGYWGHVYGADLIPFIASHEDRLACFVASCTCHNIVGHYSGAFWSPPFWARQGDNMGIASRTNPAMYYSRRSVATNPLPFLTQEMMAFVAPRPFLVINANSPDLFEAVRPVWKLYGKGPLLELISHKWGTNQPVNARDHTVDFLLRTLCGIYPGKAPEATAKAILDALRSNDAGVSIPAARLAGWWRLKEATEPLLGFLDHKDVALRRAAAKALHRIGAMKEIIPHLKHPDPVVRLAAVEMMQVFGTEEAFRILAKDREDDDRWVNEAKWQTLQVNPWE
ncbi:MAG TPA: HEAT repeat domain-containing protein [Planctomycetota bacterium]|nr:HEAT repeat domain-containing protein [Planctomycetota bacterium]